MYTEDYENRGFPFRDFLLKLILIIIFVFLLVWLLPKFITPKLVENNGDNSNSVNTSAGLSALTSQVFSDNLNKMKEAAISYYTDERLPKEVGESHKMTLNEMIEKKLIIALVDKNNKACDTEASYVKITKADDEYILKVNLKDSEKEDYILVHLGCYSYCDTYVCEKEETQIAVKGDKPSSTTPSEPSETSTPEPSTSPEPNNPEEPEKLTPSETPESTPTDEPKPTPEEEPKYVYEYEKVFGLEFSAWTKWSNWTKTNCETKEINCSDDSSKCLKKLQLYSRKEKIGTYDKKYVTTKDEVVQTGSYTKKTCSNYNYVIINNKTYATTSKYASIGKITSTTTEVDGWKRVSLDSYENPPRNTNTTIYIFAGADYSPCDETCESLPNFYYYKWVYTGSLSEVTSTTSTTVEATCGSYVTETVPIYGTIEKSYIATRKENLYGTVCYQSTKTRTITNPGKTQYKWSYYNDTSLLNNGWTYTGERELTS